jgi:DNA-binding beta-propeller fold protein YncE
MKAHGLSAIISIAAVTLLLSVPEQSKGTDNAIYWSSGSGDIYRTNTDGTGTQHLVSTYAEIYGLAVDSAASKMYWTNWGAGKIQRSNLNGSQVEDVLSGLTSPVGITLDVARGRMYWADIDGGYIRGANLDGSNMNTISGANGPMGIAVDSTAGKLYWSDAYTISRSNLDGSGLESVITYPSDMSLSIALDTSGERIYWVNHDEVGYADFDGSNRHSISSELMDIYGVAVDPLAGKVYWTGVPQPPAPYEPYFPVGGRANLDGSGMEPFLSNSMEGVAFAIAIGPVPEPATLLLLTLGGLILQKHKPQISQITQK